MHVLLTYLLTIYDVVAGNNDPGQQDIMHHHASLDTYGTADCRWTSLEWLNGQWSSVSKDRQADVTGVTGREMKQQARWTYAAKLFCRGVRRWRVTHACPAAPSIRPCEYSLASNIWQPPPPPLLLLLLLLTRAVVTAEYVSVVNVTLSHSYLMNQKRNPDTACPTKLMVNYTSEFPPNFVKFTNSTIIG